jgi:UDP-glucuronate 4-epimerase
MKILVTGAAGFIGMHTCFSLLKEGHVVYGLDSLNSYYDKSLKYDRLATLGIDRNLLSYNSPINGLENFVFSEIDLLDSESLFRLFSGQQFEIVINLAAQAGVRYSITNPKAYIDSNIIGFFNILEACRFFKPEHLVYASSSSVYGNNTEVPFNTNQKTDSPVSFYAATKKSNELMAYTYSHLYQIPITGLRFFTVYGPWGRPDMAYFTFTKNILEGKPIQVYEKGELWRDFTFIDDIVEGVKRVSLCFFPEIEMIKHRIFNIGNHNPVKVIQFIEILEELIGKKAIINFFPMQAGDVYKTYADVEALSQLIDFKPDTDLRTGLSIFVNWYREYYSMGNSI